MRKLAPVVATVALCAASALASASPSNPAFLGISFGQNPAGNGALIGTVTPGSPAADAGLQSGDVIIGVDDHPATVNDLNGYIVAREPGDRLKIQLFRHGEYLELIATLTTRAAMFDRLIGHALPDMPIEDSETEHDVDLAKPSGHATVIAWYHRSSGGGSCIDPVPVVENIARRVSALKGANASVVGATYVEGEPRSEGLASDRKRLGLPVLVARGADFRNVAIDECGRVFAMVLDCRGIVTFLTPITDGDDEDAALDEIATAAAQADHKRR